MSAIAYITDSKMLELHRLNNHKTVNFWRLSTNVNFSDFGVGDLVFFLSKDKEHRKRNEKGIVGFGRVKEINVASIKTMWDKYGLLNGYQNIDEFKESIIRVSKDKKLPKKISGFLLENVTFFQPIYLSECGIRISNNIESYIYLKPAETVTKLLRLAKESKDLWSDLNDNSEAIEKEEIIFALFASHKKIGDIEETEKILRKARKVLNQFKEEHEGYEFVQNSNNELYRLKGYDLDVVFYNDKEINDRLLIGQAGLYKRYLEDYYDGKVYTRFISSNHDGELNAIMNKY